ncbi:hypothetical protein JCM10212_001506 [Sporobolomyces blumeae]
MLAAEDRWSRRRKGRCDANRAVIASVVFVVVLVTVTFTRADESREGISRSVHKAVSWLDRSGGSRGRFNSSLVLNHSVAQDSFHRQLKPDVRYITTMSYGGHANQFIGIQNMLYLAKLLNRVAIIPTLTPLHFDGPPQNMSKFYDVDRFYQETAIPVVELAQVKYWDFDKPPPVEPLTCWSVLENVADGRNVNDGSMAVHMIDVKYYPLPEMTRGSEGWKIWFEALHNFDSDWWSRGEWIQRVRNEGLPHQDPPKGTDVSRPDYKPTSKPGFDTVHTEPPTDAVFCLDTCFFVGSRMLPPAYPSIAPTEPPRSYEGHGWIDAGQHLRFSDHLERLGDLYLERLFDVSSVKKIPPIITCHIRRGDFAQARGLTSLEMYTDAVQRVRDKLNWRIDHPDGWDGPGKGRERFEKGFRGQDYVVVVATDEKPDSEFVRQLKDDLGWKVIDHDAMRTGEELGGWYPLLIDSVILSRGGGFVGTEWSTFSYLAGLRVKYWNGGVEEWTPSLA